MKSALTQICVATILGITTVALAIIKPNDSVLLLVAPLCIIASTLAGMAVNKNNRER